MTFDTEPKESTEVKDISMEVDDNSTDIDSKKQIVSPAKPGPSTIISPEEDSGFDNMDVDEPKERSIQESIRRKRPLEVVS